MQNTFLKKTIISPIFFLKKHNCMIGFITSVSLLLNRLGRINRFDASSRKVVMPFRKKGITQTDWVA